MRPTPADTPTIPGPPAAKPAAARPLESAPRPESTADGATTAPPVEPISVGGRYRPIGDVGHGGCGVVSKAHDRQLDRVVAIKQLHDRSRLDPEWRARFLSEARCTGQLQHPGIVPVHELGDSDEGGAYYVMRLLEGETLLDQIERAHAAWRAEGRPAAGLRALLRPLLNRWISVCQTVAYAHRQGVLHRDLKPANVMTGAFGETIVVDWGLAKPLTDPLDAADSSPPQRTSAARGPVVGTPQYMAPEQARGDGDDVREPADIYALGAMLYQILTGEPPVAWQGDLETTLESVRRGVFPTPRGRLPELDPALEAICLRALHPDPRHRYPGAAQLAEEMERYLADEPIEAYRDPWSRRLLRWCRHHRGLTLSVLSALVAVLLIGSVATVWIDRERRREREMRQELAAATEFSLSQIIDIRRATDRLAVDLNAGASSITDGAERQLLEDVIAEYRELADHPASELAGRSLPSPRLRTRWETERTRCLLRLAELLLSMGKTEEAAVRWQQAGALLKRVAPQSPDELPALIDRWEGLGGPLAEAQSP